MAKEKQKKEKRSFLSKLFGKAKKSDKVDNKLQPVITFKGYQANYVNYNNSILESDLILSAIRLKARFFGKLMPKHVREKDSQMLNINDGSPDWNVNYRVTLEKAPEMRIRYEVPGIVG